MNHDLSIFSVVLICLFLAGCENSPHKQPLIESNLHHEWVDIPIQESGHVIAYVVYPESKGKSDSVIVIHENRGLTDWVRTVADKLGQHGYTAICPDMLTGKGPNGGKTDSFSDSDDAREAIYELDPEKITSALKACTNYMRSLPSTTDNVSVMGFCWGGAQTFRYATNDPSIKQAMVFYGRSAESDAMQQIACPVYGFYGEFDNRINSKIDDTKEHMAEAGKFYEPIIYQGGRHGFLRVGMSEDASEIEKKAADDAWERVLSLLSQ